MNHLLKRTISFALCCALITGMVPQNVFADGTDNGAEGLFDEQNGIHQIEHTEVQENVQTEDQNTVQNSDQTENQNNSQDGELADTQGSEQVDDEESAEALSDVLEIDRGVCGDDLTWVFREDGTLTISGTGPMYDYNRTLVVTSPNSYYYSYDTTAPWGKYLAQLREVYIEDNVSSIGMYAFSGCKELKYIQLPQRLSAIPEGAFAECSKLSQIVLPIHIQSIGKSAFLRAGLQSVKIPDGITVIEYGVFSECKQLKTVELPNSVKRLDTYAFAECSSLTSVSGLEYVIELEDFCFMECSSLQEVNFPSVEEIHYNAFRDCTGLREITLGKNLRMLGDYDGYVFRNCTGLQRIVFQGDAPEICENCFMNVTATVYYPTGNTTWTEDIKQKFGDTVTWCDSDSGETIPHTHSYEEIVVEPTCTEKGYTTHVCTCGESYTDSEVNALGHSFGEWAVVKAPTLTEKGEERRECSQCDEFETREIEKQAHSHAYSEEVTAPTCTEKGYTTYTCACGDSYKDSYTETVDHSFGEWYVVDAPTQTTLGEKQRSCYSCQKTESQYINELCGDNLDWNLSKDGVLTISGYGKMYNSTPPWYDSKEKIVCVIIGDDVENIGDYAFIGCNNLSDITWGRVSSIGKSAFHGCTSLEDIVIPGSVKQIGVRAFENCNFTQITISEGTIEIGGSCFITCQKLEKVSLPTSLQKIGSAAFEYCYSLKDISLPNGITYLGSSAFCYCTSLETIEIPGSIKTIESWTFDNCTNLSTIIICDGVENVSSSAFSMCKKVNHIEVPNSVSSISFNYFSFQNLGKPVSAGPIGGGYNFEFGWKEQIPKSALVGLGINELYIPESILEIEDGENPYNGDGVLGYSSLSAINVAPNNQAFSSIDGVLFNADGSILFRYPPLKEGNYSIPSGVKRIANRAFSYSSLSEIVIPDGVSEIGWGAFLNCSNIESVQIPESVEKMQYSAFSGCSQLREVVISGNVKYINDSLFSDCRNLTNITLPNSVISIGTQAFSNCSNMTSLHIPNNVTSIGTGAFRKCSSLKSVIIPRSVTKIYDYAFFECSSLNDVYYSGSEAEWDKISIWDKNECLTNANIHYNSDGPESSVAGYVRYFYKWDSENQIAYFGPADLLVSQVTEKTNPEFLTHVNDYIGKYLLVETTPRTDGVVVGPDILINVQPVDTNAGTVNVIGADWINIDDTVYGVSDSIKDGWWDYSDQFVIFHSLDGKIIEIELLDEMEGVVEEYDEAKKSIKIRIAENEQGLVTYSFTPITNSETLELMINLDVIGKNVSFFTDANNLIYRIGEISDIIDISSLFCEPVYRADYLIERGLLAENVKYVNYFSPAQTIMESGTLVDVNTAWTGFTLGIDNAISGTAILDFSLKQSDVYESILLNSLLASVDTEINNTLSLKIVKKVNTHTKFVMGYIKDAIKLKNDWNLALDADFQSLSAEQREQLYEYIKKCRIDSKPVIAFNKVDAVFKNMDTVIKGVTTVEDFFEKLILYSELWEVSESMARVLVEMKNNTPNDINHQAMWTALDFCQKMIQETNNEQFGNGAILHSLQRTALETSAKDALGAVYKAYRNKVIAANPELTFLLFAYKASRTITNVLGNTDDISEQIFKLDALCKYYSVLNNSINSLEKKYLENRSIENAETLLDSLELLYSLAYEDCDSSAEFADVVDDAWLYTIEKNIFKKSDSAKKLADYTTFLKGEYAIMQRGADWNWIFALEEDYPELFPVYEELYRNPNLTNNQKKQLSSSILIACPVNVSVFDAKGNKVINLVEQSAKLDGSVEAILFGDMKCLHFYSKSPFIIRCDGYADGKMDVTINEYTGVHVLRSVEFSELAVTQDTNYEVAAHGNNTQSEIYSIESNNSVLTANHDSLFDKGDNHSHCFDVDNFTWSEDYAECTVRFNCKECAAFLSIPCVIQENNNDSGKTKKIASVTLNGQKYSNTVSLSSCKEHLFDQEIPEEKYLVSPATCESPAAYYKSCICGEAAEEETFEYGEPTGHSFSDEWSMDETHHWHKAVCEHENEVDGFEAHIWDGNICQVCGYTSQQQECTSTQETGIREGRFHLFVGNKDMGLYELAQSGKGWTIQDADGYLAVKNNKLVRAANPFVWNYSSSRFYVTVRNSGLGSLLKPSTSWYLSANNNGLIVTTSKSTVTIWEDVSAQSHSFSAWTDNQDGTHRRSCSVCGEVETGSCTYDNETHLCACGAYDPAFRSVSVNVSFDKRVTRILFIIRKVTYYACIDVETSGTSVRKVEYSTTGGRTWKTGTTVSSNREAKDFLIRVTDKNGTVYRFACRNGQVEAQ